MTEKINEYFALLQEYAAFLEKVRICEGEKLTALLDNDLKKIEHSISASQANEMQMQVFEKKRIELQRQAGFADKTFKEILQNVASREKWQIVFEKFEKEIDEIKFLNSKSMKLVNENLAKNGNSVPNEQGAGYGYTKHTSERSFLNNTKV